MSEQLEVENVAPVHSASVMTTWSDDAPIRGEVYGLEHLEEHARLVAAASTVTHLKESEDPHRRFLRIADDLQAAHDRITAVAQDHGTMTGGAEWLLDNYYIVLDNLREIRHDLPHGYYRELPKLVDGPHAGLPRVYALAHRADRPHRLRAGRNHHDLVRARLSKRHAVDDRRALGRADHAAVGLAGKPPATWPPASWLRGWSAGGRGLEATRLRLQGPAA